MNEIKTKISNEGVWFMSFVAIFWDDIEIFRDEN